MGGSGCCSGDGSGHVVYGSHGYGVELAARRHGFNSGRPDFCVLKGEGADGFAEKCRFLILGFREGYAHFGVKDGYGEAGEACSGA